MKWELILASANATRRSRCKKSLPRSGSRKQVRKAAIQTQRLARHIYSRRKSGSCARIVPHANSHIHGRGYSTRSQLSSTAPRPFSATWHSQRLQRLPHGKAGGMDGNGDRKPLDFERKGFQTNGPSFHAAWTSDLSATTSLTSIASGTHNGPKDPGHEARGVAASIQKH